MKLYNSLSKQKEVFVPINEKEVSMYHCGPTVYDYVHIGNLRSFLLGDLTRRIFEFQGYEVKQVMNITDVGHLVSDGDEGDDKMTKALKRHGMDLSLKNMIKVGDIYTESFVNDLKTLNIKLPHHLPKASDHIQEDIDIIKQLEEKEYTYTTSDGVYFRTDQMESYGVLGGLSDTSDTETRISENSEKESERDFALWKFDDQLGWDSPWGQGFPGWHIECSGMSMKYLGTQFDIHTGGSDLASIHHNNEIAQSECATGHAPYVKYWLHGGMLNMKGAKLSKSTGGNITLKTLEEKNIDPLAYRYLCLQTHYRQGMNFSFEILEQAQEGYKKIINKLKSIEVKETVINQELLQSFTEALQDDMNLPQALAVFHEAMKLEDKGSLLATVYTMDKVLGLDLKEQVNTTLEVPQVVIELLQQRKVARENKDFEHSDILRDAIKQQGYEVRDIDGEQKVVSI